MFQFCHINWLYIVVLFWQWNLNSILTWIWEENFSFPNSTSEMLGGEGGSHCIPFSIVYIKFLKHSIIMKCDSITVTLYLHASYPLKVVQWLYSHVIIVLIISVNWLCWTHLVVSTRSDTSCYVIPAVCCICCWCVQFKTVDSFHSHRTFVPAVP